MGALFLPLRSDIRFIAVVAGMGLLTDVCLFPLFTPAIPFRLEELGYDSIASLTGWLTAAYAGGLILATFPFTWLGSRYKGKRNILLVALALMAVGILVFLLVPNYAAMVAARILQGASGAGIWTLGLALVADNCEPERMGKMMGVTMVGYAIGNSIGQPVGGVLYGQLGWKAPSIFALILIAIDFGLRLAVVEKHEIECKQAKRGAISFLRSRRKAASQPHERYPQQEMLAVSVALHSSKDFEVTEPRSAEDHDQRLTPKVDVEDGAPFTNSHDMNNNLNIIKYNHWTAIMYLCFKPRPLTPLLISFTNGFIISGIYNTALVLRLNERYGLDSTKAGLVYFAVAIPSAIISPLAGRLCDRFGPRPLSLICCSCYGPVLALLMIDQLPLAAFIVLLALAGCCAGLINAPVMVFLAQVAAESNDKVGTSHVYGGFNFTFSVACFVGPIVAGQVLERLGTPTGFKVQVAITAAMSLACVPLAWLYMRPAKKASIA